MARLTPQILFEIFRRPSRPGRRCQYPDCDEDGIYRAPMSRHHLRDYYWFCLEHIRGYNRSWNYYAGMNADEIEAQRRQDTVWHRPSWPAGGNGYRFRRRVEDGLRRDYADVFVYGDGPPRRRRLPSEPEKALSLLDLGPETTLAEVKARYKTLAKRLHPDANGGDPQTEERLKAVNQAYAVLKGWYAQ